MSKTIYGRVSNLSFTSSEWSSKNPILKKGEVGYDTTLKLFKIGDGTSKWSSLPWSSDFSEDLGITVANFT